MLSIVPCTVDQANAVVALWHRHHQPTQGGRWALAVADEQGTVRGVAIVGRPVARELQDGWTVEVTRNCCDGCRNAPSMLYAAAWDVARGLGWRRMVTYLLASESGASLKALREQGWRPVATVKGRSWDCPGRRRVDKHPTVDKVCWEVTTSDYDRAPALTWPTPMPEAAQIEMLLGV